MRNFLDHLDPRFPIFNAGMGGVAGAAMASAVNAGGGVGVLACGAKPPHLIAPLVAEARRLTSRPLGGNIILPMSDGADVEACFDSGLEILVLFWGDPQPFVADAHKRGMFVLSQCGGPEDAVLAADAGVDGVIVQGTEAGGHVKAHAPLASTLSDTVRVLGPLPVIAAGGITNGTEIQAALSAGASAVTLGTRFLASPESLATEDYKARVLAAHASDTVLTKLFDLGWPDANHRVIRNKTYDDWEAAGKPATGSRPGEGDEVGVFGSGDDAISVPRYSVVPPSLGFEGDIEAVALYAGESVEQVNKVESVAEIMATLIEELRRAAA
jgi:nitronate monooxygenase